MKRKPLIMVTAAMAITLATAGAVAHGGATGIVKERMELMKTIGDAMKSLTAMMRGKETYEVERVRSLARTIGAHGGEKMTALFPDDSLDAPTEAMPTIWTDWERFEGLAGQLSDYATALGAAAVNDRMGPGRGMMDQGMGQGQRGGMMMGNGQGMMGGGQGMMMGRGQDGPDPELLATMPPDAAFMHLAQTCAACHQDFRKEK